MTSSANPRVASSGRRWLTAVLGVLVTLALLSWVLHGTSLSDILAHLREARPWPLLAAVLIATAAFGLRTIRWRLLLRAPEGGPLPWSALWHATAMGFMANNTLPFRLGEVLRSYAASRLGGVPLATALSSIAVERALDLLTLVALLGLALFRTGLPAGTVIAGSRLDTLALRAGVLCVLIFAAALLVVLFPLSAERLLRALVPFPRLADRLVKLIEGLRKGFEVLRRPARLALAVLWSLAVWLANGASFYVAFAAFGIQVDFAGALLVQTLLAFGVAAPSTPGYFGVFELVVAAALKLFGVSTAVAVAYGITYHITTFIPITLLGLYSLVRTGLHVRDATAARR
ncbi:MAG TPA: lysylphosphatidylglycerol synthase transmembrane domain-containing protein [Gemmatimonadales bacterium]|nr:lysylphosphatidylglycerol synthase transmembrane domain-containing protein [Gemmatimonadales bacterium]